MWAIILFKTFSNEYNVNKDFMCRRRKRVNTMAIKAKSPHRKEILDMSKMTEEEIDAELEKGYQQSLAGMGRPIDVVVAEFWRDK